MEIQLFAAKPSDAISQCFPLDIEAEFLSFRQFHSHFEWHCFVIIYFFAAAQINSNPVLVVSFTQAWEVYDPR